MPDGEVYYRHRLKQRTTTNLDPEEVHYIGLSEVARIKKEMNVILLNEGYADNLQKPLIKKFRKCDFYHIPDQTGFIVLLCEIVQPGYIDPVFNHYFGE
ncbi:DUF885 family protein [Eudoraea sp.]|uniref:DUF885 family protein n=1 Tax=Eudoraea sp. TaxID=1979955 RepID=UPI003C72C8C5